MTHQPGEAGFEAEHLSMMAGCANGTAPPPTRRPLRGHIDEHYASVGQLARDYFAAMALDAKHKRTIIDRRRYIEQSLKVVLTGEVDDHPVAHWAVDKLNVRRMILVRDASPDPVRPLSNNGNKRYRDQHVWAMRAMFNWGIKNGWQSDPNDEDTALKFNPAAHIEPLSKAGKGWHVWSVDELNAFIAAHPPGTMPYLCLVLLLFTVLRRSDVIRLGTPLVKDGAFNFHETKGRETTLKERTIELRPELRRVIDAMPLDKFGRSAWQRDTFLISATGKPYSVNALSHDFKEWTKAAGIAHCTPHGVRKFVATAAGSSNMSDLTVAGLLGHTTTKNIGPYTNTVRKDTLFEGGIETVLGIAPLVREQKRVNLRLAA